MTAPTRRQFLKTSLLGTFGATTALLTGCGESKEVERGTKAKGTVSNIKYDDVNKPNREAEKDGEPEEYEQTFTFFFFTDQQSTAERRHTLTGEKFINQSNRAILGQMLATENLELNDAALTKKILAQIELFREHLIEKCVNYRLGLREPEAIEQSNDAVPNL